MKKRKNKGWFRAGRDARRHTFTREECSKGGSQPTCHRLTREHRVKGGHAAWARTMAETRLAMGLPLPTEEVRRRARSL
jgi:hypothetical protein